MVSKVSGARLHSVQCFAIRTDLASGFASWFRDANCPFGASGQLFDAYAGSGESFGRRYFGQAKLDTHTDELVVDSAWVVLVGNIG